MRIAVISDIHGNVLALEAVLADIGSRSVDRVVNLGDVVSGPLWPRQTMEMLSGKDWITIRGNHDRPVTGNDHGAMGASDRFAVGELHAGHRHWLAALPMTADIGHGILAFHGIPGDDNTYLVEELHDRQFTRGSTAGILRRLGDVTAKIVLCGHSHQQHLTQLPDGPLILNPGSVGCPAGSPHARYAVIAIEGDQLSAEMIALNYAWETAAQRAEQNDRPEWAHVLRTGDVSALL